MSSSVRGGEGALEIFILDAFKRMNRGSKDLAGVWNDKISSRVELFCSFFDKKEEQRYSCGCWKIDQPTFAFAGVKSIYCFVLILSTSFSGRCGPPPISIPI